MTDELKRLLTETLRGRETDVEPMPDLAANVLRKGRSARNRRLALGWGTTSVVAAAAVVAVALLGARWPAPAKPSTRKQSYAVPDGDIHRHAPFHAGEECRRRSPDDVRGQAPYGAADRRGPAR